MDFTNGQALNVAIESVRQTDRANRQQIAQVLGATGQAISFKTVSRGKNKGKVRMTKGLLQTAANSFAARILGKRFKETKSWGIKGDTMEQRIHNFIQARMRSAAFIASGWIGARNALFSVVKKKPAKMASLANARQYGQPKGKARPATFSLRSLIVAQIENTALMQHMARLPATGGNPMPLATAGLQKALNVAAADMTAELAKRLDPDFKRVSAK